MRALFYFLPLLQKLRGPLMLSLALSLVTLAAGIGLLGISGWFLTAAALSTAGASFNLFGPSAGVRGLSFIRILSRYGEKLAGHNATLQLLSDLRRWLFQRMFRLVPLGRRFGRGDLVSRLIADLDALDTVFLVALGPMLAALVTGVAMTSLLAIILPAAAPFYALGFALAVLAVPLALVTASRRAGAESVAASAQLRQTVLDGLDGHRDLVLFGAIDEAEALSARAATRLAAAKRRLGRYGALASGAVQLLAASIMIATLLAGLAALSSQSIAGPTLVGMLLAVIASFEVSAVLVRSTIRLSGSVAAAERLITIAEAPVEIGEPAHPSSLPAGGQVVFQNVSFGYGGRNELLHDVSFTVTTGECVAIRGVSGSGKSTIAHMLVRLVEPLAGTILVNGTDIRHVVPENLRQRVALMSQDAPIFHDSVRNNLLIGRPGASDAELWQALHTVHLADAISALPTGLDTLLGEAGQLLSAGQARRIALARTLLSTASVIVLDEPTSGLDPETEGKFLRDLPTVAHGRTMIVITHAEPPATFARSLTLRAGAMVH